MTHLTRADIEAALDDIRSSPSTGGRLEQIVRRPTPGEREVLEEGILDLDEGLVGDSWSRRPSSTSADGGPHPDMQVNVINARFARLIAGDEARAALAGDQLHVDLDLSEANVPPGTRLHIGEAVIEITEEPHTGCQKFSKRFGLDALRFVNSPLGRELHLRGVNARVVVAGLIRRGDVIRTEQPARSS